VFGNYNPIKKGEQRTGYSGKKTRYYKSRIFMCPGIETQGLHPRLIFTDSYQSSPKGGICDSIQQKKTDKKGCEAGIDSPECNVAEYIKNRYCRMKRI